MVIRTKYKENRLGGGSLFGYSFLLISLGIMFPEDYPLENLRTREEKRKKRKDKEKEKEKDKGGE